MFGFSLLVASLGPAIEMDLAAGPARTGFTHLPEILFFAEAPDTLRRQPADLDPQPLGFIVVKKNRRPKFVLGQAPLFSQEIPGPFDSFGLVVIAEGPIAEHFKKSVVVGIPANGFQVVVFAANAQALL